MKAVNIEWDVDSPEDRDMLPTEIEIPKGCILRRSTAAGAVLNGSSAPQTAGGFQRNSRVNGKGFAGAKAPH